MESTSAGTTIAGTIDQVAARRAIERELDLVNGAIELVASGGSRRVTVAGLRFGEQLLAEMEPFARACRVNLRSLWTPNGPTCDIAVEAR